ncbi:MAG: NAD(P)-dependent oxidoreductase [Propionibacteriaceae bacterium]|jgi:3-hydroxyisobutyrate dehydrogenase|nr:NAD(P)-dependent oxidoreductase [Propionibacteriaceae bacterium]
MTIGVIGVGRMGWPMAARVVEAGMEVVGTDARAEVVAKLPQIGVRTAESPKQVSEQASTTILMVMNAAQADEAIWGPDGFAEGATPDSVLVTMASLPATYVQQLAVKAAGLFSVVDCPVSGGVEGAEAGTLTLMVAGDPATVDRIEPVLAAVGSRVFRIGKTPGLGCVMKSINQAMFLSSLVTCAEMVLTGVKAGLDPDVVVEVVSKSSGDSWALRNRLPLVWRNDYVSGGALDLMVKDIGGALTLADELGVDSTVTKAAARIVQEGYDAHHGLGDDPLIIQTMEERNGVLLRPAS